MRRPRRRSSSAVCRARMDRAFHDRLLGRGRRCGCGRRASSSAGSPRRQRCAAGCAHSSSHEIHLLGFNGADVLHRPLAGVLEGCCRHDDVAGNQFLGLQEWPVVHADAIAGVLVSPSPPPRTHGFGDEVHAAARGLVDQTRERSPLLAETAPPQPPSRGSPCAGPCSGAC